MLNNYAGKKWATGLSDQEAHDALAKMANEHPLDGVNPPSDEDAAAGTMKPEPMTFPDLEAQGGFDALKPDQPEFSVGEAKRVPDFSVGEAKRVPEKTMTFPELEAQGGFDALAEDPTAQKHAGDPFSVNKEVGKLMTGAAPDDNQIDITKPLGFEAPPPTPRPGHGPMVDTEMLAAQQKAKEDKGRAELGKAVTAFTERPTNFLDYAQRLGGGASASPAPHNTMWDEEDKDAEQPVKDLLSRRASEAALKKSTDAADLEARMKDPNSDESKFARSLINKNAPGLDLEGKSADEIQRFAPWVTKVLQENGELIRAQALAQARQEGEQARITAAAAVKAAEEERKKGEEATNSKNWRQQMESRYPKEISALAPGVWDNVDMKVGQDLQNAWESDRKKKGTGIPGQSDATWRAQMESLYPDKVKALPPGVWDKTTMRNGQEMTHAWEFDRHQTGKPDKEAAAETKLYRQQRVPGYTWDGTTELTVPERSDARNGVGLIGDISTDIEKMKGLIDEHGTETWPTRAKAEMAALHVDLAMKLKAKSGFDLGVISGHDMDFLNQALGDPTVSTFMNEWNPLEAGNLIKRLDTLEVSLKQKLDKQMAARGYTKGEKFVKMQNKAGKVFNIPVDMVKHAKSDPDEPLKLVGSGEGTIQEGAQ